MTTDREERYQKISQILEKDLSEKEGLFIGKFSEELEVERLYCSGKIELVVIPTTNCK